MTKQIKNINKRQAVQKTGRFDPVYWYRGEKDHRRLCLKSMSYMLKSRDKRWQDQ